MSLVGSLVALLIVGLVLLSASGAGAAARDVVSAQVSAEQIGYQTATLYGTIDSDTPYHAEMDWGLTTAYGASEAWNDGWALAAHEDWDSTPTGLQVGQTYHVRLVAHTQDGQTFSSPDFTFQTKASVAPAIVSSNGSGTNVNPNNGFSPGGRTTVYVNVDSGFLTATAYVACAWQRG